MTSNMSELERLAYRYLPAHSLPEAPLVVFVHGFLGAGDDWDVVNQVLPEYHQLTIDLPGHGKSCLVQGVSFDQVCRMITATILDCIQAHKLSATVPVCLVGYSLGARLLMYLMTKHRATHETINELNISGLVIEGGNFGLPDDEQKAARWRSDSQWGQRFTQEEIGVVLADWYQQTVFSSLNHEQRQLLIAKRSVNLGSALSDMLLATSLAKQPDLLPSVKTLSFSKHRKPLYICGEFDNKFTQLAVGSGLDYEPIASAGHNVHKEQPVAFASRLRTYLEQMSSGSEK